MEHRASSTTMQLLHSHVVATTNWLRASPEHRAVVVRDLTDSARCNTVGIILAWIHLEVQLARARVAVGQTSPVAAAVLHDVVSALHGRDRLVAGAVCRAWHAATHDALLDVDDVDVRAWVGPRIAEMVRVQPEFTCTTTAVEILWALTRYWLSGGE
jgi:hypothetical protein